MIYKDNQSNILKKILISVFILIMALAIVGCDGNGNGRKQGEVTNYRVGTQGLEMRFLSNAPSSIVYAEDESFPVSIEVVNRGVYPGENDGSISADIHFVGFDKDIIGNLDVESIEFDEEESKTRYNPEGGYNIMSVDADVDFSLFEDSKIDTYDAKLMAVICYPYKTFLAEEVCIDPNPNRNIRDNTCTPGTTGSGSQGAPIAITSVESISQRGKSRFIITLSNVGGGNVIRTNAIDACVDSDLEYSDFDKIEIIDAQLSNGISLDCTPQDDITLVNGYATIVCKADGLDETMPAFKTLLQMELDYGYKKSISKTIQIRGN